VGMGVLFLQFRKGENCEALGLDGPKPYAFECDGHVPAQDLQYQGREKGRDGDKFQGCVLAEHGGILPCVLRNLMR